MMKFSPKDLFYSVIKNENSNVNTENEFLIYLPEEKKSVSKIWLTAFVSVFIGRVSLPNLLFFVFDGVC